MSKEAQSQSEGIPNTELNALIRAHVTGAYQRPFGQLLKHNSDLHIVNHNE